MTKLNNRLRKAFGFNIPNQVGFHNIPTVALVS